MERWNQYSVKLTEVVDVSPCEAQMLLNSVSDLVAEVGKATHGGKSAEAVETGVRSKPEGCKIIMICEGSVKNLCPC